MKRRREGNENQKNNIEIIDNECNEIMKIIMK